MSDNVQIALITSLPAIVAAVLGFINNRQMRHNTSAIHQIKEQTNSMKDALVKVTGEAEFAKGVKQGEENPKG